MCNTISSYISEISDVTGRCVQCYERRTEYMERRKEGHVVIAKLDREGSLLTKIDWIAT